MISTLVTLLFAIPGLQWGTPLDHLEIFAGQGEVTLAELQAGCLQIHFYDKESFSKGYHGKCIPEGLSKA